MERATIRGAVHKPERETPPPLPLGPTFFLRSHQNSAQLAMTSTATTGPAMAPGLIELPDDEAILLQTMVGHCEHVLRVVSGAVRCEAERRYPAFRGVCW